MLLLKLFADGRNGAIGLRAVAVTFVTSRLALVAVIMLSRAIIVPGPFWQPGHLLGALTHGDGAAYVTVAETDDWLGLTQHPRQTGFFPFFPLAVKAASLVLRNTAITAVLLANVSLLFAGFFLHRLAYLEFGDARISRAAVTFLMFAPGSVFLSAALPESTALMLAIGSFLAARMGRWGLACAAAVCLSATMSMGAWIVVPLATEYVSQHRRLGAGFTGLLAGRALLLGLIPLYPLAVMALGGTKFDDVFALFPSSTDWQQRFSYLVNISGTFAAYRIFYELLFPAMLGAATLFWLGATVLKMRPSVVVYAGLLIAACAWSYDLEAPRTLVTVFPLFIAIALVAQRVSWVYELALTSSVMLFVLCAVAAANGFWLT